MKTQSKRAGFTLIELLVVVSLVAILLSLAMPSLAGMANSMRLTTATNSLFSSLMLARNEAIMRNSRAVVCKSATGNACITTGDWEQGWIVFHDANNNAALDAGEVVFLREHAVSRPIRLTGNGPVASYVSYNAMGETTYPSGALQFGTLTICNESATQVDARKIKISSNGRPRTLKTTVANCL